MMDSEERRQGPAGRYEWKAKMRTWKQRTVIFVRMTCANLDTGNEDKRAQGEMEALADGRGTQSREAGMGACSGEETMLAVRPWVESRTRDLGVARTW